MAKNKSKAKKRADGFANALTGMGDANHDKRLSTVFRAGKFQSDQTLTSLYRFNGLSRRIVNLPAVEMTRNWFTINGDEDDGVLQKLETLGAQEAYTFAEIWARLYGGSVILIGLNDGMDLWRPVNESRIRDISYLRVFDRREVDVVDESISRDPTDPLFGEPTKYMITPITGGNRIRVHATRLIRFDGAKLPGRELQNNNWWHDSILESVYEQIRQMGAVYDSSEFIVNEFVMTIVKIDNMLDMIMAGKDDLLKQRLAMLDLSKHVKNTLLIDSKEDFAKHSSTVAGLDKLLDSFMMSLSSVTGIPVTLLMGRSPAGQNATGESDIRMWYDSIRSAQRSSLRPRLETLIRYCFVVTGSEPETWSVEFNPLWEMTDKEMAEVYKLNSEGDDINIANSSLSPADSAMHRFGGQTYNPNPPTIDPDDLEEQDELAKIAEAERVKLQADAEAARKAAEAQNE